MKYHIVMPLNEDDWKIITLDDEQEDTEGSCCTLMDGRIIRRGDADLDYNEEREMLDNDERVTKRLKAQGIDASAGDWNAQCPARAQRQLVNPDTRTFDPEEIRKIIEEHQREERWNDTHNSEW